MKIKYIPFEKHGVFYGFEKEEQELWCIAMFTERGFPKILDDEDEEGGPVVESPDTYKKGHEEALKLLGVEDEQLIKKILNKIAYYSEESE
ncbi:hypothetical protein CMI37_30075 [Candidatus Pacearchaeota archaeon]|nr:hypothetical protein [Candidatus Pacearchaeota archaeon]